MTHLADLRSYDQLFKHQDGVVPKREGGGGKGGGEREGELVGIRSPRGAAQLVESAEDIERRRFVVKHQGQVLSVHASRQEAEAAQVAATREACAPRYLTCAPRYLTTGGGDQRRFCSPGYLTRATV
jgi:hypothetical protein